MNLIALAEGDAQHDVSRHASQFEAKATVRVRRTYMAKTTQLRISVDPKDGIWVLEAWVDGIYQELACGQLTEDSLTFHPISPRG